MYRTPLNSHSIPFRNAPRVAPQQERTSESSIRDVPLSRSALHEHLPMKTDRNVRTTEPLREPGRYPFPRAVCLSHEDAILVLHTSSERSPEGTGSSVESDARTPGHRRNVEKARDRIGWENASGESRRSPLLNIRTQKRVREQERQHEAEKKTKVSSRESHLLQPRPTGPRGLPPRRNLLRTFQSVLRLLFLDGLFPIPAMFLSCDGVPTLSLIFPSCSASSCLPDMGPTEAQYKETRLGTSLVSLRFSSAPFVR